MSDRRLEERLPDIDPRSCALLLVDVQQAFGQLVPVPDGEAARASVAELLALWRSHGLPVLHTRHVYPDPQEAGWLEDFVPGIGQALSPLSPFAEFWPEAMPEPGELVFAKTTFSGAREGGDLLRTLHELERVEAVVVVGLTTPICVTETVEDLAASGFRTLVVSDACASQALRPFSASESHAFALARLRYAFSEILTTVDLKKLFERSLSPTAP